MKEIKVYVSEEEVGAVVEALERADAPEVTIVRTELAGAEVRSTSEERQVAPPGATVATPHVTTIGRQNVSGGVRTGHGTTRSRNDRSFPRRWLQEPGRRRRRTSRTPDRVVPLE